MKLAYVTICTIMSASACYFYELNSFRWTVRLSLYVIILLNWWFFCILCFVNKIDFISSCNSLHQSEKQRKGWVRWGVDLLRNHLPPNFSEDFSMCHYFMQGLKKIEETFAQERKVVDDLLDIAKVFCIFNKWNASLVLSVCFLWKHTYTIWVTYEFFFSPIIFHPNLIYII